MNAIRPAKKIIFGLIFATFCMAIVDGVWQLPYLEKSISKAILFTVLPFCCVENKKTFFSKLLKFEKKGFFVGIFLGVLLGGFLFFGYLLLKNFLDFSNIVPSLERTLGVTKENFLFVSMYIAICNSFLEEFFFRGFGFLELKRHTSVRCSATLSALLFALYHVAMIVGWVPFPLVCLAIFGLFCGGLIFNYLNYRYESLYPSWFVHLFCNVGINSVGLVLMTTT
ncbi:MAG: CPBP family glutamic-type intramembrane protease [Bacillota bacterium]